MLSAYLAEVTDQHGLFSPQRLSDTLRMPLAQLARIAKVHRNTLTQHPGSPAVQARLGEVARVVATAADLLGGDTPRAIVWFRHQPLAGFDGQHGRRAGRGRSHRRGAGSPGDVARRRLRLSLLPSRPVHGRFWRMLAPKWAHAPLSGAGAAARGGRCNEPGMPALYMSERFETAVAELSRSSASGQEHYAPMTSTLWGFGLCDPALCALAGIDRRGASLSLEADRLDRPQAPVNLGHCAPGCAARAPRRPRAVGPVDRWHQPRAVALERCRQRQDRGLGPMARPAHGPALLGGGVSPRSHTCLSDQGFVLVISVPKSDAISFAADLHQRLQEAVLPCSAPLSASGRSRRKQTGSPLPIGKAARHKRTAAVERRKSQ